MNNIKYKTYLLSTEWNEKKQELFLLKGYNCERCLSTNKIQVHHKTYANLYNERLCELEVLCSKCHYKEHFNKKGNKKKILSVKQILAQKVNRKKYK